MSDETAHNTLPGPWNFGNDDKGMVSPSGKYRLEYGDLREFGQGSPLQGALFLTNVKSGKKVKLFELAGGPPVWDEHDDIAAVPVWWMGCMVGRSQRLLLIDLTRKELVLFKKKFKLLDLKVLSYAVITGTDSPVYKSKRVVFNIGKNKVAFKKAIAVP
ncbi:MAG: hypothetical protein M0D57_22230 [Sphingobacteriales bacterium JAD_PAG50586_3]|nr:MAG: hypothetical protein M0D57_22230 [Sphingobacteriales bacterium JAD_PAG50586_3]